MGDIKERRSEKTSTCFAANRRSLNPLPRPLEWRSASYPHERPKAGLFEMVIRRERIDQALVVHDGKGNAIGERPSFIRTAGVECCARAKLFDARRQNFDVRCGGEELKQSRKLRAIPWLAKAVAHFGQNPVGGDQRARGPSGEFQSASVEIVGWVQERDEIGRVGKNCSHCFGAPCR